jgi:aminoglycoside 2''-phosphotransferase
MDDLEKQEAFVKTIASACQAIPIRAVRLLTHDGEFNDILVVNEELIFRFPRRTENIPAFLREMKLLAKLRPVLPLPIPAPIFDSGTTTELGKVFMGYRLIPGQPLNPEGLERAGRESLLQTLAMQLAAFLTALHRLTPEALGLDLPILYMPTWTQTFFEEVRKNLFFYMREDACKTVTDTFETYFRQGDLQKYSPCLVHGDFGGSNILFDGRQVSGVLDFAGACTSDPALDIASVSVYGEEFFVRICRFFPVDETMLRRAKFYRSLFALEEAMYGWKSGDEAAFSRGMEQYI